MTARSRPMPLEDGSQEGQPKRFMKFDPTINTGTIAQIIVIVASAVTIYTGIREDQVKQRAELDSVKAAALVERLATKEALADLKTDVKELQKSTNEVKESLAILRGRQQDNGRK
jgi:citrate synthase